MKNLSFTHPHAITNLYGFLLWNTNKFVFRKSLYNEIQWGPIWFLDTTGFEMQSFTEEKNQAGLKWHDGA